MAKFKITLERTDRFEVEVEADTAEIAMEDAREMICHSENPWDEYGTTSDGFEPSGWEEC
jgi:hypothetical protein